jgi:hypothetical protein
MLRGAALLAAAFLVLFGLRLGYGYLTVHEREMASASPLGPSRKNYATEKKARGDAAESLKYEKVASTVARSSAFEKDETRVRDIVKRHDGIVQLERSSGLAGRRELRLAVGVPPERFDDALSQLRNVGALQSIHVEKNDKTSEYKELRAKKAALEKARANLFDLKKQGGKLDEVLALENRVLEIENELQKLGNEVGEFDSENELCTLKATLVEEAGASPIPFLQRARVALLWTTRAYGFLLLAVILAAAALLLGVRAYERFVPRRA